MPGKKPPLRSRERSAEEGSLSRARGKKCIGLTIAFAAVLIMMLPAASASATERDEVTMMKNFGGAGIDDFVSVTHAPGGFVAVGNSHGDSFGSGNWSGVKGKGLIDAVIVRYDIGGNIRWSRNFGGSGSDYFNCVTAVSDGFVAAGYSYADSFGSGDWNNVKRKGISDGTIVKYSNDGRLMWKKNFGGSDVNVFTSVTAVSDGYIVVGYSFSNSFGNGDWTNITGNGGTDAVIVKYDTGGNVVWKKNFGGQEHDYFFSVRAAPYGNGFVAAGCSSALSFGSGDWIGVKAKGEVDATIAEFDRDGNVVWKTNHGGTGYSVFYSVTAASDGPAAAGFSTSIPRSIGDPADSRGKGDDAIIVKYDKDGAAVWGKNFGGPGSDAFCGVTLSANGFVAVGYSESSSFENGDWVSVEGKGGFDGIIVRYSAAGEVEWKKNIGGPGGNFLSSVAAVSGGFIAVGSSGSESFGGGDWTGNDGRGGVDAFFIRYLAFVPVSSIINVPHSAVAGKVLTLSGTVAPFDATDSSIVWRVVDAGTTGATISGNKLSTTGPGIVVVEATVANGIENDIPYTQIFTIAVTEPRLFDISDDPSILLWAGVIIALSAACAVLLRIHQKRTPQK